MNRSVNLLTGPLVFSFQKGKAKLHHERLLKADYPEPYILGSISRWAPFSSHIRRCVSHNIITYCFLNYLVGAPKPYSQHSIVPKQSSQSIEQAHWVQYYTDIKGTRGIATIFLILKGRPPDSLIPYLTLTTLYCPEFKAPCADYKHSWKTRTSKMVNLLIESSFWGILTIPDRTYTRPSFGVAASEDWWL